MAQQCPLIFRHVDANLIRINTAFVTAGVVAYVATAQLWIPAFLAVDFVLRLYGFKHLSPIQITASRIQSLLKISSKMEDAGAKRLAAFFGLGFMIALFAAGVAGLTTAVWIIAAIYLVCAIPYLAVGYCVGCQIYYLFKKLFPALPDDAGLR